MVVHRQTAHLVRPPLTQDVILAGVIDDTLSQTLESAYTFTSNAVVMELAKDDDYIASVLAEDKDGGQVRAQRQAVLPAAAAAAAAAVAQLSAGAHFFSCFSPAFLCSSSPPRFCRIGS